MYKIEWKESLSVGIDEIDNQHKILIGILNDSYEDCLKGDEEKIFLYLKELWDYTEYHFDSEDKIMQSIDYPNSAEHLGEHFKFISEVAKIKEEEKANNEFLMMKIVDFLSRWLNHHILTIDKKLGEFYKSR